MKTAFALADASYRCKVTFFFDFSNLFHDVEIILFRNDRQTAPSAMQLADAVNLHDDSFSAIVAVVLALQMIDVNLLTYLVGRFLRCSCTHILFQIM